MIDNCGTRAVRTKWCVHSPRVGRFCAAPGETMVIFFLLFLLTCCDVETAHTKRAVHRPPKTIHTVREQMAPCTRRRRVTVHQNRASAATAAARPYIVPIGRCVLLSARAFETHMYMYNIIRTRVRVYTHIHRVFRNAPKTTRAKTCTRQIVAI